MLFRQAEPFERLPTSAIQPLEQPAAPHPARKWLVAVAVTLVVTTYWLLATSALRDKCNTCDEVIHLTGGYSYWLLNDYRLQPENGNLPQRWHALPAVLTGSCRLPPAEHPAWKNSNAWEIGQALFFDPQANPELLLNQGREMAALLGVGICLTVFFWSRRLFGLRGAFVSLVLTALCPALLAHGPLMTSDACLTLFLLLSVWSIWELLHVITPLRLVGGMLAIAGLFLSKMSAPLIFPMAALMVVARLLSKQPLVIRGVGVSPALQELGQEESGQARRLSYECAITSKTKQLAAALAVTAVCGLFAYTAVWAAYGFRYSAFAEGPLTDARFFKLDSVENACRVVPGRAGHVIAWMADKKILPEGYLYGTAFVLAHLKRVAFFNGEYSITGWRNYFPYCFAVKTPLALFGIMLLSSCTIGQRLFPAKQARDNQAAVAFRLYDLIPFAVLLVVFGASAINSTFNIGYRHILPIYPVLYILAGSVVHAVCGTSTVRKFVAYGTWGLVLLFAAESLAAYPNYIAFFNPLLSKSQAYNHLVDSNLDWGQDLPSLAKWLEQHNSGEPKQPVFLGYFGNGRPSHHGIESVTLQPPPDIKEAVPLTAGLYCLSATRLQSVYEGAPGHWNKAFETRYQSRRELFAKIARGEPPTDETGHELTATQLAQARAGYEYGKYLRLLAYLRHRQPDDNVNYSILIFRLTAEELDQALNGPPAELDEQPWLQNSAKYL